MSKQQAKAEAVKKIGVIIFEKVDESTVDASLELLGEPTDGSLEDKVRRIGSWFSDNVDQEANLVECTECNGVADITKMDDSPLPHRCPYCGDGDAEIEVSTPKAAAPKKPAPAVAKKKESKIVETTGEVIDMEAARKTAQTGTKMARVRTRTPAKDKAPESEKAASGNEAELDAKVDEYKEAVVAGVMSYVQISHILREIDDKKLWKSRLNTEGKKRYDSFEEFAHSELQMSKAHAYRALAVAKSFTPEEIQKHGFRKLAIIANFKDPIDKAKLMKQLESGASKRGLEKAAGKLRGTDADEDTEENAKIFFPVKRLRMPMLVKGKGEQPAKRLQDDPHCQLELPKGGTIKFRIQVAKSGQIELVAVLSKAE